ncbi:MAG: hypothetical protein MJ074_07540 [Oscillospiraceae bacterium]|nr:hypothetical protein [Oscillospiraceae bacterium]
MRVNKGSDFRFRAELWRNATSPERDALGQHPIVPERVCSFWCARIPQTGSLLNGRAAETVLSRTTHKIVRRMPPHGDAVQVPAGPEMWIIIGGVRYDILYTQPGYPDASVQEIFCEVRQ